MIELTPKPLTADVFSPYGDVIGFDLAEDSMPMNYDMARRFYDLAEVDVTDKGGETCVSLVRAKAISFPFKPEVMEHHPLGSQIFYPLGDSPFLILVAPPAATPDMTKAKLFISNGKQGINYHKKVWHHYLMALKNNSEFIVIDRKADDKNCVEVELNTDVLIIAPDL